MNIRTLLLPMALALGLNAPALAGAPVLTVYRLEGVSSKADVLLGLDVNLAGDARETGLFAAHGVALGKLATPQSWNDPLFAPFDWGHFAFVHEADEEAVA